MGTARKNSLTRMFESSVTNRVLELTTVPVEVIAGDNQQRSAVGVVRADSVLDDAALLWIEGGEVGVGAGC